jgi:preprotein translocase subunit SecA
MTGTAETEAPEFMKIYKLDVVVIPTNEPVRRINYPDVIYQTKKEKYKAIIDEIKRMNEIGRPVLVGTVSVEVSELLSRMIPKTIKHSVLNAKRHKEEAEIVAEAGKAKAVTLATNMAGRGTDIKLGPGVVKCKQCCVICEIEKTQKCSACPDRDKNGKKMSECKDDLPCGLHIIATERHESRRIDRQLRGRCARQGDPGSSRFYLSLEDDLLRIFGAERISSIMERLEMEEGECIEHKLITSAIERAQARVEGHNFDMRKHLLEYDDVMNKQREVIYQQRNKVLHEESLREEVEANIDELGEGIAQRYAEDNVPPAEWDMKGIKDSVFKQFSFPLHLPFEEMENLTCDTLTDLILAQSKDVYQRKEAEFGEDAIRQVEKMVYLQVIDTLWKEHLLNMDHLKEGIGLRGYGQRDPLREYQKEGYEMFLELVGRINSETIEKLFIVQLAREAPQLQPQKQVPQRVTLSRGEGGEVSKPSTVKREGKKVGRNEPCPCGSGKKYKKCCGK